MAVNFKRQLLPVCFALGFAWLLLSPFTFTSCASRSSPSGGARDTTAAVLDTTFPPNQKIYFKEKEILLVFNEFINLKSAQQQILISPPLDEPLEIEARAKEVYIKLNDTLRKNTTYIISFGEAVTDFTEGNVSKNLKYVFSTGSYIDSLSLSGSVKNAYTAKPETEMLVALYRENEIKSLDSFRYKQLPNYYAYLTEEGTFSMTNLKAGKYRLFAFADKGGDFKLNTGSELFAFWPETLELKADSIYRYSLQSYLPTSKFRFYNGRLKSKGKVQFSFSAVPDSFKIEPVNIPADSGFFKPDDNGDTLYYWFNAQVDSLVFKLNGSGFEDSIYTVFNRKYKTPDLKFTPKQTSLKRSDTLFFTSNLPLLGFTADSIFYLAKDTLPINLSLDSTDAFSAYLPPPHKTDFSLKFTQNVVKAWFNAPLDSSIFRIEIFEADDLGSLQFTVKADTLYPYILQIYKEDGTPLLTRSFIDSTVVNFTNYPPTKMQAYLVQDLDTNTRWSPGNYDRKTLPELRIKYAEAIEMRANWELELEWRVKAIK